MSIESLDYSKADLKIVCASLTERTWRVNPQFKEPETVQWIDDYVNEGDVFYDVGANVGGYGLIAASRGATVYAFEPEAMNFGRLVQNIELNPKLKGKVYPFCVALWDRHELLTMHMHRAEPGAASHNITELDSVDGRRQFSQTLFTVRMDDLDTWDIPQPNHIKVDVDGYEWRVLAGATLQLEQKELKSVMCEIESGAEESDYNRQLIFGAFKSAGLIEKGSWGRMGQPASDGSSVDNYLFVRP